MLPKRFVSTASTSEDKWRHPVAKGLDVRHKGEVLTIAYRTRPHALRVPLPIGRVDPSFSGWPQVELEGSAAHDAFFTPVTDYAC